MNKDQIQGQIKNPADEAQKTTNKQVDSKPQEIKGAKLQDAGQVQQGYGDAKDAKDAKEIVKDDSHPAKDVVKPRS